MSDNIQLNQVEPSNVVAFPALSNPPAVTFKESISTPQTDELVAKAQKLDLLSSYPSTFDYNAYKNLELRYKSSPIRGGIYLKTAFRLVNSHSTCQQCLYAFEIDTYGRGCVHDCAYCYARVQLSVHAWWNRPIPVPININEIRDTFYTVFETDKKNKWREIMERKIPLRIGSMSDSFMWMDTKYKVTQELLKILRYYKYPYIVFTRSDLVAHDDYIKLLDPSIGAVQMSLSSTNDDLNRKLEPGAPSAKRRLVALQKLSQNGIWTTVRINPLFPIYPDGYFTNPDFSWEGEVPKLNYSSFEMIDEIAAYGVPAVLAGFVRFSRMSLNEIEKALQFNVRQFYNRGTVNKSPRDFHFSDKEIRYYYEELKKRCIANAMEFTTCYIGNGEGHFWKDQDIWSNKRDCCNVKGNVPSFKTDAREIAFDKRLKFTNHKNLEPESNRLHENLGKKKSIITERSGLELT